jgi:hypothetical protein
MPLPFAIVDSSQGAHFGHQLVFLRSESEKMSDLKRTAIFIASCKGAIELSAYYQCRETEFISRWEHIAPMRLLDVTIAARIVCKPKYATISKVLKMSRIVLALPTFLVRDGVNHHHLGLITAAEAIALSDTV